MKTSNTLMSLITLGEFKEQLLSRPVDEIVQECIFGDDSYVFTAWPDGLSVLRQHLSSALNVSEDAVTVVGSAKVGFSLNPANFPRQFSESSDIDIIIIDEKHFDKVWATILKWHYPRRYIGLYGEDRGWAGSRKKNTYWGWFEPDQIHFEGLTFPAVLKPLRDLSTAWFNAFRSLSLSEGFAGRDVRGRLYRTWEHALMYHVEGLRQVKKIIQEN
ncbi:MAG: hypothetical protein FVQ79_10345 [Planctomycetes bacterium]|nr:hypothetical protein [Planctomycetota bacterium]